MTKRVTRDCPVTGIFHHWRISGIKHHEMHEEYILTRRCECGSSMVQALDARSGALLTTTIEYRE